MPDYGITYNWIAIAVVSLAAFMLGALWYHPILFGKAWVSANGFTETDITRMRDSAAKAYSTTFLGQVVCAVVLTTLIGLTPILRWQGGLKLGILCCLGFAATTGLGGVMFGGRKIMSFAIDAGYQLVYMAMMGAVLAAWR